MYTKHHTNAFVIGSVPAGEADRRYFLFTDMFGLVFASAKSSRSVASRLRFALQDFSYSRISLVRGRESWRITNTELVENLYGALSDNREKIRIVGRSFALLRKLLSGEEANPQLFTVVKDGTDYLKKHSLSSDELKNFEVLFVLKILGHLGYINSDNELVAEDGFANALPKVGRIRAVAIAEINEALAASQM